MSDSTVLVSKSVCWIEILKMEVESIGSMSRVLANGIWMCNHCAHEHEDAKKRNAKILQNEKAKIQISEDKKNKRWKYDTKMCEPNINCIAGKRG